MPGQQLAHATKEGDRRRGVVQRDKVSQGLIVYIPFQCWILKESLDLRSEQKSVRKHAVEQGFYTETVSYNPQSAFSFIPKRERKHTVETLETLNTPFLIRL